MADLISHPFRISRNSSVALVPESSDAHLQEQVTIAVLTQPGERLLVPQFGINDPAFGQFDRALLITHIEMFGPDIEVISISSDATGEMTATVVIEYDAGGV